MPVRDYSLQLEAHLPVSVSARMIPPSVRDRIASSITSWRIHESADGFIERSIRAYQRSKNSSK